MNLNIRDAKKWVIYAITLVVILIAVSIYAYPNGMANGDLWLGIKIAISSFAFLCLGISFGYSGAEDNRKKEVKENV
jgi:hypothetical protein